MADLFQATLLGALIAFVTGIPMAGPNGALVLQRLLEADRRSAGMVALGAAAMDGLYAVVVGMALAWLLRDGDAVLLLCRGLGALVVGAVGILFLIKPRVFESRRRPSRRSSLVTGAVLTGLNPTLLATWSVVESTLWANGWLSLRWVPVIAFAAGVAAGRMAWFGCLSGFQNRLVAGLGGSRKPKVMRGIGGVLLAAALFLGYRFAAEV